VIAEAAEVIRTGGIVVFPTQCLYGLGADAFNVDAVERIYAIKKRSLAKPILILVADPNVLIGLVQTIPIAARKLISRFWPGNLTVVLKAGSALPPLLTSFTDKIGIREVGQPIARAIVSAFGGPITGTSANWAGHGGIYSVSKLPTDMIKSVDLVLDVGELKGGLGSTVVDVTLSPPKILREGFITTQQILTALR
jgi:L-threonylcarbamoyladenylate synthase